MKVNLKKNFNMNYIGMLFKKIYIFNFLGLPLPGLFFCITEQALSQVLSQYCVHKPWSKDYPDCVCGFQKTMKRVSGEFHPLCCILKYGKSGWRRRKGLEETFSLNAGLPGLWPQRYSKPGAGRQGAYWSQNSGVHQELKCHPWAVVSKVECWKNRKGGNEKGRGKKNI